MRLDDAAAVMGRNRGPSTADGPGQEVKPRLRVSESGKFEDQFYHAHEGSRAMGRLRNRAYLKKGDKKDSGKAKKNANVNARDVDLFSDADIVQSGYLVKQGSFWKTWRRRYFVLRRDLPVMSYFSSKDDLMKLGEIAIDESTTVEPAPKDGFPNRFIVEHKGRKLVLLAETTENESMESWVKCIESCIEFRKTLAKRASGSFDNRRSGGSGDSFRSQMRLSENASMVEELLNDRASIPRMENSRQPNSMKRYTTDSVAIQKAAAEATAEREAEGRQSQARRSSRLPSVLSAPLDEEDNQRPRRLYRSRSAGSVLSRLSMEKAYQKAALKNHDDNGVSTLLLANHPADNTQSLKLAPTERPGISQLTRAPSLSLPGFKPPSSIELAVSIGSKGAQENSHMMVILSSVAQGGRQEEICRTEMKSSLSLRSCGGDFYARDFSVLLSVPRNAKSMLHFELFSLANPNSESLAGQKPLGFVRISPLDLLFSRDSTIVLECHGSKNPLLFLILERILPGESINIGHAYTYAKRCFIADTAVMEKRKSGDLVSAASVPASLGQSYRDMMRGKTNSIDANHVLVAEELSSSYISVSMTVAFLNFLQRRNLDRIENAKKQIEEFRKEFKDRSPTNAAHPIRPSGLDPDSVRDLELEMAHYMRLHAAYLENQKRYQSVLLALEEGREQGITGSLKRSNMKKDKFTEFMPTNLNCHLVRARRIALSNGERRSSVTRSFEESDSDSEIGAASSELVYEVTTHGCAAAHVLGFKEGGLRRLQHQLMQTPNDGRLRERIEQREDVVRSQVLAIAGAAFLSAVGLAASKGGSHYDRLNLICSTGFLVSIESLLSTVGAEKGMLEDMSDGIKWLNRSVNFQVLQSIEAHPRLKYSKCVSILSTPTGDHIDVAFAVPTDVFKKLPVILQEGHAIKVHAVMFTQGINEMQSVANHYLNSSLQDELNSENADMLERYFRVYQTQVKFLSDQNANQSSHRERDRLTATVGDLNELQREIQSLRERLSTRTENVQKKYVNILIESSDICRRLGAGRTTCCKSGKDRTAMSVTLETSRVLVDYFHVKQGVHLCNAMRERGVRRVNVLANTGKDKYAFNSFQLMYIPDCYKPPVASADSHVAS